MVIKLILSIHYLFFRQTYSSGVAPSPVALNCLGVALFITHFVYFCRKYHSQHRVTVSPK